ncbi:mRNA capping enzyme [Phanerochaete sordida]|uniref:mRNA-capping enzyme subunit alpha n=1 Tax=Phanerochaete sordida TaxID=48140 RepID=A0A9P3LCQ7_9APHY|nr:mRNA capping enzyme [Phanerochaete sordida]
MSRIPEIPGRLIPPKSEHEQWLRLEVARLCQFEKERFPGSQPVSFGTRDLEKLENQDYWVCEKSDGVRVLLFVQTDLKSREQAVFLIDRHNAYREVRGIYFPHHENPMMPLRSTIVDGELVTDTDPRTQQDTVRFLAFDCLVVDDQNVMSRPLDKRYGRLQEWFYKPYSKMLRDHPHMTQTQPFEVRVKDVKFSYHIDQIFEHEIPQLHHGNDGLIYTCVSTPYTAGTDPNILKWKPPSENSIDFRLVLRFPPSRENPREPDYYAKPVFELHVWAGGLRYEPLDTMYVTDDEWEKLKASGEQLDDRIVEVHWDAELNAWRMMRFRTDKPHGNHKSVVDAIIKSIADGVEKDQLLARSNAIRNAWKTRQMLLAGQRPPPPTPAPAPPKAAAHPLPQPPAPPPQQQARASPRQAVPDAKPRFGPLASSPWSKVSGPAMVNGMHR